jgi:hypothetical protein
LERQPAGAVAAWVITGSLVVLAIDALPWIKEKSQAWLLAKDRS